MIRVKLKIYLIGAKVTNRASLSIRFPIVAARNCNNDSVVKHLGRAHLVNDNTVFKLAICSVCKRNTNLIFASLTQRKLISLHNHINKVKIHNLQKIVARDVIRAENVQLLLIFFISEIELLIAVFCECSLNFRKVGGAVLLNQFVISINVKVCAKLQICAVEILVAVKHAVEL